MGETRQPLPAGPAAAAVLSLAADLALLTASLAGQDELAKKARVLSADAEELGHRDATVYAEFLESGTPEARQLTIELPLRMVQLAAEIGEVAADAGERGKPDSRFDAIAGAILAESAARAAGILVDANLRGKPDQRADAARRAAAQASAAASRALALL